MPKPTPTMRRTSAVTPAVADAGDDAGRREQGGRTVDDGDGCGGDCDGHSHGPSLQAGPTTLGRAWSLALALHRSLLHEIAKS
ncbi:Os02g0266650 [Oryza sativa Japonica Group]|uniref:Os02g0266650 protein n=1 Tax=Oryza sativa subsp. japonica TaxID=39947 RepID=A0A0P0VHB8_ORYSJ|nr:Os02g0266650 [Oryza sativa Japonica Group]